MNVLESYVTDSPYGVSEECAKFTIDVVGDPFTLSSITTNGQEYTLSFWVKSDETGSIVVYGEHFSTSPTWAKYDITFTASKQDLKFTFRTTGTYYIYRPQLERGNKATDWTPAPEDVDDQFASKQQEIDENKKQVDDANDRVSTVEASLKLLADSVITRVIDDTGETSVLEQKGTGWVFSLLDLENSVSDALDAIAALTEEQANTLSAIDSLKSSVSDHGKLSDYVAIGEYDGQPCIELGEVGGDFKLRITNTEMYFIAGSAILTTITNQKMIAEKIEVTQELQQGNFVWMLHGNGNLGLLWKGGSS